MNTVKPIRDFAGAQAYLRQFYDTPDAAYSLDTMRKLMDYLGDPQNQLRVVHVAGTSGKTSTAYYAAALLTAGGCKTGLTVSPHVDALNERVQINGRPVPEKEFCAALEEFARAIEFAPVRPTWFECVVAFAYWYFAREKVNYAVVEVGLGGLLDGTNVVNRPDKVCVITDIGFDHKEILGETLAEIAVQKFGIVVQGNSIFMHQQPEEVMAVACQTAHDKRSELHIVESDEQNGDMPAYQGRNWQLAYEAYEHIRRRDGLPQLAPDELKATRQMQVPGRMDVISYQSKTFIMDGAHNAQKIRAFVTSFRRLYPQSRPAIIIGMREGKDYVAVVPLLAAITDRVICTAFETSQDLPVSSVEPDKLAEAFNAGGVAATAIPDQQAAVAAALNGPADMIIITGSLYLLGQIRHSLFT